MNIHTIGWIAIAMEIILLMIWVYSIFFVKNGTDPAGKGIAMGFLIALCMWVGGGILLLLLQHTWSTVIVLIMAGIPLSIVVIGLIKHFSSKPNNY